MEKEKKKLGDIFKKIKIEYIAVAALAVILLILATGGSKSESAASSASSVEQYVSSLEKKLEACLSRVKDAGSVEVIISVSSGMKTVYAQKEGDEVITVNGKPLSLREEYPEITGVVIVAEGANKIGVKLSLLSAAEVFLAVDEGKIKILSMK